MSALLHVGEADHNLLRASAEIDLARKYPSQTGDALLRASVLLLEVHAALGAVRFLLRSQVMTMLLAHHREMAQTLPEVARRANMPPGCSLRNRAEEHKAFAKALTDLIGA